MESKFVEPKKNVELIGRRSSDPNLVFFVHKNCSSHMLCDLDQIDQTSSKCTWFLMVSCV
jgi:hypothetical protein